MNATAYMFDSEVTQLATILRDAVHRNGVIAPSGLDDVQRFCDRVLGEEEEEEP